nr:nitrous oxide reductase maturation protein [uncultured bacterium]
MSNALEVSEVTKGFAGRAVVSGVTLAVRPGERVALLGHNGAGKTTLMRMILGLIRADAGRIDLFGHAPGGRAARRIAAYLPENVAFNPTLTGREQLRLYVRLKGSPATEVDELLQRVGLADAARRRIGTWSKGMRQRLGLAQALIGNPRLLVLDEPTTGLDPVSRREFYAILAERAADGTAILLSSHALTEVEARTDRIAILRNGRLVADDTLAALRARAGLPTHLRVRTNASGIEGVAARLGGQRINGHSVDLLCTPDQKLARLAEITGLGAEIEDIEITPPSLEDIYAHFSRENGSEGAPQ